MTIGLAQSRGLSATTLRMVLDSQLQIAQNAVAISGTDRHEFEEYETERDFSDTQRSAEYSALVENSGALELVDYEVLIVDDNSPDLTWSVAEQIGRTNPRVRMLRRMENPGLGMAVIEGFSAAEGDILACIDADLQHDPAILPRMIAELQSGVAWWWAAGASRAAAWGNGIAGGAWNRGAPRRPRTCCWALN